MSRNPGWLFPFPMVVVSLLIATSSAPVSNRQPILNCRLGDSGACKKRRSLVVENEQWAEVKRILCSRDAAQISTLVSEKYGIRFRGTYYQIPSKTISGHTSKRKFIADIRGDMFPGLAHQIYEAVLHYLDHPDYERRIKGNNWEIGLGSPRQGSAVPQARVIFFCEKGKVQIKLMAAMLIPD